MKSEAALRRARRNQFEGGTEFAAALHQVVIGLQAEEEAWRQAEVPGQAQIGVGGDRPLAEHNLVDPAGRHAQCAGKRG